VGSNFKNKLREEPATNEIHIKTSINLDFDVSLGLFEITAPIAEPKSLP